MFHDVENVYITGGISNAKSKRVLLEWTSRLCLGFVLYDMRLVNTFIIVMCVAMNIRCFCKIWFHLCKTE